MKRNSCVGVCVQSVCGDIGEAKTVIVLSIMRKKVKRMDNGIFYEAIINTQHYPEYFNTTIWNKFSDFELFLMFCALFMKEGEAE